MALRMPKPKNLFIERNDACPGCGRSVAELQALYPTWDVRMLITIDHILPKSYGGQRVPGNMEVVCYECNQERQNQYPWDWWGEQFLIYKDFNFTRGKPKLVYVCDDCDQRTRNIQKHKLYCNKTLVP